MKPAALIRIDAAGKQVAELADTPASVVEAWKAARDSVKPGETLVAISGRGILKKMRVKGAPPSPKASKSKKASKGGDE